MKRALGSSKPLKMWIDGKCFELYKFQKRMKNSDETSSENKETHLNQYDISTNEEGKLFTSFHLPSPYYIQLSKFQHWGLSDLENKTKTNITIPKEGNLVITGATEDNIVEARDFVHSVIGEIRNQSKPLQFISIPTLGDEIIANATKFKEAILNEGQIKGMEESIFLSPLKLHLTIAVFVLFDDNEKSEAIKALQDYKTTVFEQLVKEKGPLKIRVSGIDCMNQNLKKVDVLYAKANIVDENEETSLQRIVNEISDHFYDRGLMKSYQENVKLHMTLINTKYRKTPGSPQKTRWNKKQSFDATKIMEKYKDFYFGECLLDSIHLSLMSTVGDDGFYKPLSIISVD